MRKFMAGLVVILVPLFFYADVVVDGFEGAKTDWKAAAFIGGSSGMEETMEDTILVENSSKEAKTGNKSLRIEYTQNPAKENKFAQIAAPSSEKVMGDNKAVSFYAKGENAKTVIAVRLFDRSWKKWSSQEITIDNKGWRKISLKSEDLTGDAKGKWAVIAKMQIIVKGSCVLYIDDVKYVQ